MGFFDTAVNDAVPQNSLTKPLIIAAGALLLAKWLKGGSEDAQPDTQASTPVPAPAPEPSAQQADTSGDGGLLGGLGGLLEKFQQSGQGDVIKSWIGGGQNQPIQPGQLGQVLGQDTLNNLAQKAGVNPNDLLGQLAQHLPEIINKLTPNGRLPNQNELGQ
ncbi:YidB family protein [Labrys sp. KB_33_2]|uniref:YidB family protein n=1 Tax=unclassified Labrys (in: a-proteobacteria) TaxID=2688601 RepID=UPI003EBBA3E5